jgi:beta-lactam-binding protein with PASTA domain
MNGLPRKGDTVLQIKMRDLFRFLLVSVVITGLCGCVVPPRSRQVSGGYVELDENTDPVFVHHAKRTKAGKLKPFGRDVYVNGRRSPGPVKLLNNSHVRTEPGSFARIDFASAPLDRCLIGISQFFNGKLYGDTRQCLHILETSHGGGESSPLTRYHVWVNEWGETEIMLQSGSMVVWPLDNPSQTVAVHGREKVIITPTDLHGPVPISHLEIRERTEWRKQLKQFVDVPNLKGKTNSKAQAILKRVGLRAKTLPTNAPANYKVYRQQPASGVQLRKGDVVRIEVRPPRRRTQPLPETFRPSLPSYVSVPNLNQKTASQAKAILNRLGLKVKVNPAKASNNYRVYKQSPGADTTLAKGRTVTIEVRPPRQRIQPLPETYRPSYVNVPNLNQRTVSQAKAILNRLGLKVNVNPANAQSDYWVYKQSPSADTRLSKGGTVTLEVTPPLY